jgi:TatA/E family protein of Tat protein translocase
MLPVESAVPLFIPVGPEAAIILAIIVLLFGGKRIPKAARATGQSIAEFRRGREESHPESDNQS